MKINKSHKYATIALLIFVFWGCKSLQITPKAEDKTLPNNYTATASGDTSNIATIPWRSYFADSNLKNLIDQALLNNQELNRIKQEIDISKNEIRARKGEYLPFISLHGGATADKVGEFSRNGAVEKQLNVKAGTPFPEPYSEYDYGAYASWEIDIWKKLRNAKKAAAMRYLASIDGKNFMVTQLVSEIASTYYELIALDNLLAIVENNITLQTNAFEIIQQQKNAAKVSQLAVNRFEAQLLNTKNLQYEIRKNIVLTENKISFLIGSFSQPIQRSKTDFQALNIAAISTGTPAQLLMNRPDIRQAELALAASKLDIKVAKAQFYPAYHLQAGLGLQSFKLAFLFWPESILYSIAGEMTSPLVNRNALKAQFYTSNAKQIQAVYTYEQTLSAAFLDVVNELAKVDNYKSSYATKLQEVDLLKQSVGISNSLFNAARADYMEVLLTQREALNVNMELIEIKLKQINAQIGIYRALGGGWN